MSKAAEAWRKGDGAGAKRFSREGQEWNEKVSLEGEWEWEGRERERGADGFVSFLHQQMTAEGAEASSK